VEGAEIRGDLAIPAPSAGIVVFAHGTGSGRHSPRNRQVARRLEVAGFATLLVDLLTEAEEDTDRRGGRVRFDVGLLAGRLRAVTRWVGEQAELGGLAVGYFGASTGAAAALMAASGDRPGSVKAIVSRGGRPDLAGESLGGVRAPTLLVVGGRDETVLELNRLAARRLTCPWRMETVAGATHLFEEPGALERVADVAAEWFGSYLVSHDEAARSPYRQSSSSSTG